MCQNLHYQMLDQLTQNAQQTITKILMHYNKFDYMQSLNNLRTTSLLILAIECHCFLWTLSTTSITQLHFKASFHTWIKCQVPLWTHRGLINVRCKIFRPSLCAFCFSIVVFTLNLQIFNTTSHNGVWFTFTYKGALVLMPTHTTSLTSTQHHTYQTSSNFFQNVCSSNFLHFKDSFWAFWVIHTSFEVNISCFQLFLSLVVVSLNTNFGLNTFMSWSFCHHNAFGIVN
jgi:hypothetical protein